MATVVGPEGEEIHTDEFGRVRVHFHWDRESRRDDCSSCWIHVSQPWGGAGFGGINLPRVGQEVIVDFLGGDPDHPVIVGRLFTGTQQVPYGLPDGKAKSGWRSNSYPGGGGYNEIMFDDSQGDELVNLQAEKDMNRLVKNDDSVTVGRNANASIANNWRTVVGTNRSLSCGSNSSRTVGLNDTVNVGMAQRVTAGKRIELVAGDASITLDSDGTVTIKGKKLVLEGSEHIGLEAPQIEHNGKPVD
jgi:type VI secretion system secreted protein VgrG